jgi:UDP-N-acetylmuramoyl-L-alanine---L-glutamate ligase
VAVLLNLFPEHLDWHGTAATYFADKIRLLRNTTRGIRIANAADARSRELLAGIEGIVLFNHERGFHVTDGKILCGDETVLPTDELALRGEHNYSNVCAALTTVSAMGVDWRVAARALPAFAGLPHRLSVLGTVDGLTFVDDSIATVPAASMAAVRSFPERPITLLLGGYDRGLDYGELAAFLVRRPVQLVVTLPDSGPRIGGAIRAEISRAGAESVPSVRDARDLADAVAIARSLLPPGGVVLLSPAAPSYGHYRDFEERGKAFAAAAGFAAGIP